MKEKINKLFTQYIPEMAQQVQLQLPKLKKITPPNQPIIPKLNLPKLKKVEQDG